ncbi:2-C-methyl-D-erythritol 4-phosphate cytidylyltransferase [Caminibacter pacificus]|uniref:2-C-methyl-D-erythritol 4-phosphate cytidylyltransferase n=1 Tax=Caminibacter pacificus TaxID=1424653 RepID=A0AAJ4RBK4_9BACT|nr:2-C-methyl-D-erythritol 4-phosphate cytidylyltransferase [Caminibacter pacificus]QDD68118.1 2-C-methyl-D-erythritol 4-phosphate cytidylyltransferase [Caminibacter pacificus]ROR39105.1 2-C-methyl-D-erythritol 4-phosphate cytidylyltransferase [Caminibacter pacificus]
MPKNIAVILAGGVGSRFGGNIPKQFTKLAGKTIIEHTIDVFEKNDNIDEICIVIHPEWKHKIEEIVLNNNFKKVSKILNGGKERKDSSLAAIKAYENERDINLLFHDAVRPFLDQNIIDECIENLNIYNAIDVAIPATDTIIEVENNYIKKIPPRSAMMQGQTPQAFKLKTIKKAYELAQQDNNFKPTDDCGIVKKYLPEEPIYVVKGHVKNIKITHPQDIYIADKLFQLKTIKIKHKFSDEEYIKNLQNKVMVIFGGSYGIGKEIKEIAKKYGTKIYSFSRTETNTDVSKLEDVIYALSSTYEKTKRIDYIINTASILIKKPLTQTSYEEIQKITSINYLGAVYIAKESYKFLEKTQGHLINFTSSSYTRGRAFYSLYSSTKSAIVNLTQALAEEWQNKNIKVNCINPERTLTPMRVKNFGQEDPNTLLNPIDVAYTTINTLLFNFTGQIIDIKVQDNV